VWFFILHQTAVHEPSITAINVPLDIVSVSANWNHVIDHLPLREGPVPGVPSLFCDRVGTVH